VAAEREVVVDEPALQPDLPVQEQLVCPQCEAAFTPGARGAPQVYCSATCRIKFNARRLRERKVPEPEPAKCAFCVV
jgi:hypothetical protein